MTHTRADVIAQIVLEGEAKGAVRAGMGADVLVSVHMVLKVVLADDALAADSADVVPLAIWVHATLVHLHLFIGEFPSAENTGVMADSGGSQIGAVCTCPLSQRQYRWSEIGRGVEVPGGGWITWYRPWNHRGQP